MRKRQTARSANTAEPSQSRREIAAEAARIMADEGVRDFHAAKKKAAARLNIKHTKDLPNNQEIDAALAERLQLFHPELAETVRQCRRIALDMMRLFAQFQPRLVGAVLSGHVTRFTPVQLHLVADRAEDIAFFLQDNSIPFEQSEKRLRFAGDRLTNAPLFRFTLDTQATNVELVVFSPAAAREAPLDPATGKSMHRANITQVENFFA